jgi:magnesium transporter
MSQTVKPRLTWHDIPDPSSPQLDELAAVHSLHPLHIEDCRHRGQRTKVDRGNEYLFLVLKLLLLEENNELAVGDLGMFVGSDFLITVHDAPLPLLAALRDRSADLRPDEVLYRVMDGVVDSYLPLLDTLEDRIEELQDQVVGRPRPAVLETIGGIRSTLLQLRRVLSNTRHVAFQLRHVASPLVSPDLLPFLRDLQDDLAIDLEMIGGERERLTGVLDVYLSSVANRTTEATRTLTLLGTIALPALLISSFFGMSIPYPAWTKSPWTLEFLAALTVAVTGFLLWYLKRNDYLPGGSTAPRKKGDH